MNVGELIERLRALPQESEVHISYDAGYWVCEKVTVVRDDAQKKIVYLEAE